MSVDRNRMSKEVAKYAFSLSSIQIDDENLFKLNVEYNIFINEVYNVLIQESLLDRQQELIDDLVAFRKKVVEKYSSGSSSHCDFRPHHEKVKEIRSLSRKEKYELYLKNQGLDPDSSFEL